jgi:hypothetical protein
MHIYFEIGKQYFHFRTSCYNNIFWKLSNMWDNFIIFQLLNNRGSLYGAKSTPN